MAVPRVIVTGRPLKVSVTEPPILDVQAWNLLQWTGLAFVGLGSIDLVLAWFPVGFGNPEWEFGTISASLNGLALPTLGLLLIVASAIRLDQRITRKCLAIVLALLSVSLLALAAMYFTVVPLALNQAKDNLLVESGLRKAAIKAGAFFVVYVALFTYGGVQAWRGFAGK